jgi:hypothetical protein
MNQPWLVVHPNEHFHPKGPLFTFSGLIHFSIAQAAIVCGGIWHRTNGGINYVAFTQHQTILLEEFAYFFVSALKSTHLPSVDLRHFF